MNKEENIQVITDIKELYDKCENMEQLFDKYYLPLLDKHYSKTYKLQQENKQLKDNWNKLKEYCKENTLCYEVGDDENTKLIGSKIHGLNVLDKMQELEQGDDK